MARDPKPIDVPLDDIIEQLVPDPACPRPVRMLLGYLGRSTREKHVRVYASLTLTEYVEVPVESILHVVRPSTPLAGSHVFVTWDTALQWSQSWVPPQMVTASCPPITTNCPAPPYTWECPPPPVTSVGCPTRDCPMPTDWPCGHAFGEAARPEMAGRAAPTPIVTVGCPPPSRICAITADCPPPTGAACPSRVVCPPPHTSLGCFPTRGCPPPATGAGCFTRAACPPPAWPPVTRVCPTNAPACPVYTTACPFTVDCPIDTPACPPPQTPYCPIVTRACPIPRTWACGGDPFAGGYPQGGGYGFDPYQTVGAWGQSGW